MKPQMWSGGAPRRPMSDRKLAIRALIAAGVLIEVALIVWLLNLR